MKVHKFINNITLLFVGKLYIYQVKRDGLLPERTKSMKDPLKAYIYTGPQDKIPKPKHWKSLHMLTRTSCKFELVNRE